MAQFSRYRVSRHRVSQHRADTSGARARRSSMSTVKSSALTGLVTLALVGVLASAGQAAEPTPSGTTSPAATATPEATASPTPTPSPEPAPSPSATPVPQPSPAPSPAATATPESAVATLNRAPIGYLDTTSFTDTSVTLTGWALDADTTGPIAIHVYVDGVGSAFTANLPRPDVDKATGLGADHGFSATVPAGPGSHSVCGYAINTPTGASPSLGCSTVVLPNAVPIGYRDTTTVTAKDITVTGWALDRDTTGPVAVHVYVDGVGSAFTANLPRPDVDKATGLGANHGFSATVPAGPGSHTVCVYAINTPTGDSPSLGCSTVVVPNAVPIGYLDTTTFTRNAITVTGWALDPNTTGPIAVHVYVDGVGSAFTANLPRPDVDKATGLGANHGFSATVPAGPGSHQICVFAINTPTGDSPSLGCSTVVLPNTTPIGYRDTTTFTRNSITVTGWALDPDTAGPIAVHVYVDGVGKAFTADLSRPDVDKATGLGANHGFSATVPAGPGSHQVCLFAINTPTGDSPSLGCSTVVVPNAAPIGYLDTTTFTSTSITVTGWALDPDTAGPIAVHVYVDGVGKAFTANLSRPDVDKATGLGANHGFSGTVATGPGTHQMCIFAVNTPTGDSPSLGCSTIRNGVVEIASQYLGVPYLWGGSTPAGFDCSGLTSYVYAQLGVRLPRTSELQHYAGTVVVRAKAQPGDLIWSPGHIAIYAGGNMQVDAQPGRGVVFHAIYQTNPVFIHIG